jgi:mRNA-degrading endonuclease YafQ of YafQ-DinJ toxin-antitoxin module
MKILRYSTQFKKDIKRYANQIDKLEELKELLYLT